MRATQTIVDNFLVINNTQYRPAVVTHVTVFAVKNTGLAVRLGWIRRQSKLQVRPAFSLRSTLAEIDRQTDTLLRSDAE